MGRPTCLLENPQELVGRDASLSPIFLSPHYLSPLLATSILSPHPLLHSLLSHSPIFLISASCLQLFFAYFTPQSTEETKEVYIILFFSFVLFQQLWGSFGWKFATSTISPRELPWQTGVLNQVFQTLLCNSNCYTTLALTGWLLLDKLPSLGELFSWLVSSYPVVAAQLGPVSLPSKGKTALERALSPFFPFLLTCLKCWGYLATAIKGFWFFF